MGNDGNDKIEVQRFSSMFENICNFVAVSKTGDQRKTIAGLIKLCLFEFPNDNICSARQINDIVEQVFGITIPEKQIEKSLEELLKEELISRPGNSNYKLDPKEMEKIKNEVNNSHELEKRVKDTWLSELKKKNPDLPYEELWKILRAYLEKTFRRHGMQAAALLDPSIDTSEEHNKSLNTLLEETISEKCNGNIFSKEQVKSAVYEFMFGISANFDRSKYIVQLADGAFNFFTLEIPSELSCILCNKLNPLTLFLDTNFLFGILKLHTNKQDKVSEDLLNAIANFKLPFTLVYHEETKKEIMNTIQHYLKQLKSCEWSQSLSRVALKCPELPGILKIFHKKNAESQIDVDEFIRSYEHLDYRLETMGIKIFKPSDYRKSNQDDIFSEYDLFLRDYHYNGKHEDNVRHDAVLLEEVHNLRKETKSSLEAGSLLITCDYLLYKFDWGKSRHSKKLACTLLPDMFYQILRPFLSYNQDFDRAFASAFSLPEFRTIGSGSGKACSKMLQILATYKDIPEDTAVKILSNSLLLEKLRSIDDDSEFTHAVESAIIQENKNLLEEKAALEKGLKENERKAEEEKKKRKEEKENYVKNIQGLNNDIQVKGKIIEEKDRVIEGKDKEIDSFKEIASNEGERADTETRDREKKEKENYKLKIALSLFVWLSVVAILLIIVYITPLNNLLRHQKAILIIILTALSILFINIGTFIKKWKVFFWGITINTIISIIIILFHK